jgi:hypothetical protein
MISRPARRYFCRICGIYPFHRKRITPDHFGVNVYCLQDFDPAGIPVRRTFGLLAGYYVAYAIGLLRWRFGVPSGGRAVSQVTPRRSSVAAPGCRSRSWCQP